MEYLVIFLLSLIPSVLIYGIISSFKSPKELKQTQVKRFLISFGVWLIIYIPSFFLY
jgi:hypothetical protein